MSEYTEAEERARAAILEKDRALCLYLAEHVLSVDDPAAGFSNCKPGGIAC